MCVRVGWCGVCVCVCVCGVGWGGVGGAGRPPFQFEQGRRLAGTCVRAVKPKRLAEKARARARARARACVRVVGERASERASEGALPSHCVNAKVK